MPSSSLGAAGTVTGSMHLVEAAGRKILLDCGLFQGPRAEARKRNTEFPFEPWEINAVVLSLRKCQDLSVGCHVDLRFQGGNHSYILGNLTSWHAIV